MKLSNVVIAAIALGSSNVCEGFSLVRTTTSTSTSTTSATQLDAIMDRRKVLNTVVATSVMMGGALPAFAGEYEPKLMDMQQIASKLLI
jgi:hypothetical protein